MSELDLRTIRPGLTFLLVLLVEFGMAGFAEAD